MVSSGYGAIGNSLLVEYLKNGAADTKTIVGWHPILFLVGKKTRRATQNLEFLRLPFGFGKIN